MAASSGGEHCTTQLETGTPDEFKALNYLEDIWEGSEQIHTAFETYQENNAGERNIIVNIQEFEYPRAIDEGFGHLVAQAWREYADENL